jgi:CubicO group peptidase (beta-lactamase class C family)
MNEVHSRVQHLLDRRVACGAERGAQVAAYYQGELVVDAWAGVADPASGRMVDGETLFCIFSMSKGVTATAIHQLVERGKIGYDTPIAAAWPEFGANGKERITMRHVLAHTAGVPQMPEQTTPELMCDWEYQCRALAEAQPLWEPGTATGYHALTMGWILGEALRRVDGRSIAAYVRDEICAPLGIDTLYYGIDDTAEPHVAILESGEGHPWPEPPPGHLLARAIPGSIQPLADVFNRADVRRACLPASGVIANARAIALHYAALAGAAPGGVQLLPPERVRAATELQTDANDLVIESAARKALGYWLGEPESAIGSRISAFGHPGAGGSLGFADPDHRFACAITKNRLSTVAPEEDLATLVAREIRDALDIPQ